MDLKFIPSFLPPRFRRGDTAILRFRIHDNGIFLDSSQYDKAEITVEMPSKVELVDFGKKEVFNGTDVVSFQFAPIHMVEVGIYTIRLTLIKGEDRVSPTPIKVRFYDDLNPQDLSFITIIEDLQKDIIRMQLEIANGISIKEIGTPNGVAGLDASKKIPDAQMPQFIVDHLAAIMRSDNGAHGFRITPNGIALYQDNDGAWNNAIFAENPIGGGLSPHTPPVININEGIVTITFPDGDLPTIQKWDSGERDISWFSINGFPFTGNGFTISESGSYTLYYKLQDGREFVIVFAVTEAQLPEVIDSKKPIKDIPDDTIITIGDMKWQILDAKNGMLWLAHNPNDTMTYPWDSNTIKENRTRRLSPTTPTNIGNWLDKTFYSSLDEEFRNAIDFHKFNNGDDTGTEELINTHVGMLTLDEWKKYKLRLKFLGNLNTGYSYTITKDSTDEFSIMAYPQSNNAEAIESPFDVIQLNTVNSLEALVARPVVYADPNFMVDYDSGSEEILEPIESFNEGDTVKFGGYNWILIDKSTRKLVTRDPVHHLAFDNTGAKIPQFDPSNVNNLAYWLNNEFYNKIPTAQRRSIVSSIWDTRLVAGSTDRSNPLVEARVGLLSKNDVDDKKAVLTHFINSLNSWLITYGNVEFSTSVLYINNDGSISTVNYWKPDSTLNVNPVIHLAPSTQVSRVKFSNVPVNTLETGAYANIGGFEWVHMGDGKFAMSRVIRQGRFAESETGNTMFNLDTGIGKEMSNFMFTMYLRDRNKFTQTPVLAGRPTDSNTVYANFFGIHYNEWIGGFKEIAMRYFRDDVSYWLMSNTNSLYQGFAYSRASTIDNLVGLNLTEIRGYRPVVRLNMSTIVEVEDNIDKNGYAYIPDSELRKILNSRLGKGDANTSKITVQEMYTITDIDTFTLGRVNDLTGIELLVNCKSFKASFSLKNDEYNKVNFADVTPFIQLGKSKTLTSFNLYGVDDIAANAVLHNLKGKFPNIESGDIRFNDKIWIDTWELKGVLDRPEFIRNRTGYAYTNGGDEAGMYSMMFRVIDNSADIVKWKPFNSSSYIPWTQGGYPLGEVTVIPKNTVGIVYSQYPFYYDDTTPDGKYTIGFENANGKRSEFHVIVKDHIAYWQYDNEQDIAFASILSDKKFPITGTYTVPTTIDGLNVVEIGNADNPSLDKTLSFRCEKVVIPEQIKKIYSFMPVQRADIEIYVHNPNCEFVKPDKIFISVYKDGTIQYAKITAYGKANSTLKKLMESRAQQSQYIYREF